MQAGSFKEMLPVAQLLSRYSCTRGIQLLVRYAMCCYDQVLCSGADQSKTAAMDTKASTAANRTKTTPTQNRAR